MSGTQEEKEEKNTDQNFEKRKKVKETLDY